jgi:hypothetical protein
MLLDQSQIKYIDDYLKHHKIDYWDIRIELLDHIVSKVEALMDHGKTFESSLEEVHVGFGNSIQRYWNTGVETGVLADGRSFYPVIQQFKKNAKRNFFAIIFRSTLIELRTIKGVFTLIAIMLVFYLIFKLTHNSFLLSTVTILPLFIINKKYKDFKKEYQNTLNIEMYYSFYKNLYYYFLLLFIPIFVIGIVFDLNGNQMRILSLFIISFQTFINIVALEQFDNCLNKFKDLFSKYKIVYK